MQRVTTELYHLYVDIYYLDQNCQKAQEYLYLNPLIYLNPLLLCTVTIDDKQLFGDTWKSYID